jgi:hypothetical protein
MVRLGVGKNMVQSLRFWVQAMRVAEPAPDGGLQLTDFGRRVEHWSEQQRVFDEILHICRDAGGKVLSICGSAQVNGYQFARVIGYHRW